ncbi:hypothetical protein [Bradyrhizobium sp. 23AC]
MIPRQEWDGDPREEQSRRTEANADQDAQRSAAEELQHEQIGGVEVVAFVEPVNEQSPHSDKRNSHVGSEDSETQAVPGDQGTAAEELDLGRNLDQQA